MKGLFAMTELVLDPVLPLPVIGVLGGVLLLLTGWLYRRTGEGIARWRALTLLLFRVAGLLIILGILLRPSRVESIPPVTSHFITLVALDTSRSMAQNDAGRLSRLDAARRLLIDSETVSRNGFPARPEVHLLEFNAETQPVIGSLLDLAAEGTTTHLHRSVQSALGLVGPGEAAKALVLLTDGHDFELVNPSKTAGAARARHVPLYAVPFGKQGRVRDVSARITSYLPYCYVKQKARITAALRLIGCEFEDLTVQLLRHGRVVQTRRLNADEELEMPVAFDVVEPETGQYEYEVRVVPLPEEAEDANNSAITYLNVINQRIRVLLLEGDPYWDSTFLQRSLMRNDKFDVDSLVIYDARRVRAIRKEESQEPLVAPETAAAFRRYDVVILGRAVDRILSRDQLELLTAYVKDANGLVIFSRGNAFERSNPASDLQPVRWADTTVPDVRLEPTAEGRSVAALGLQDGSVDPDKLPELITGRDALDIQPLTATLAQAVDARNTVSVPAVVHRRYGNGQVLSVGVEGLWRWGLNAAVEHANSPLDRFWDQMILWLLAGRDFLPSRQFSFRTSSANIELGEKVTFRLVLREPDPTVRSVPLRFYRGEEEVARASLTAGAESADRLVADYVPDTVGRYRVEARFPDGTTQESRFIVFQENLEETEVVADVAFLRRLCEGSGGRVLAPEELGRLLNELGQQQEVPTPKTQIRPIWNQDWIFYVLATLLGGDWFLRRRWGLC